KLSALHLRKAARICLGMIPTCFPSDCSTIINYSTATGFHLLSSDTGILRRSPNTTCAMDRLKRDYRHVQSTVRKPCLAMEAGEYSVVVQNIHIIKRISR